MKRNVFHTPRVGMRILAAAFGVGGILTMAALGASLQQGASVSSASVHNAPVATTNGAAPSELATPFARPTYTAVPCAKRATMPCD